MTTVLVTGMGATTALSVVKGLRKQDTLPIRIVGIDTNQGNKIAGSFFCDAFYTVPRAVDDDYIQAVLQICEKERVNILYPIVDIELEIISANRNRFTEKGVYVWISDLATILTCNDKYRTYQFFKKNQIPTPATWLPEEIQFNKTTISFPLIVKPNQGVSSVDVYRVETEAEMQLAIARVKDPIIQEYIAGKEFTIDVLSDDNSKVIAVVPRQRLEARAGISYKGVTVRDERLIAYAKTIAEALEIKGACNIQCRMKDNEPIFFEINPRFSGSLPLTIAAGVNGPLILVEITLGKFAVDRAFDFTAGIYMARYWEEVFYEN